MQCTNSQLRPEEVILLDLNYGLTTAENCCIQIETEGKVESWFSSWSASCLVYFLTPFISGKPVRSSPFSILSHLWNKKVNNHFKNYNIDNIEMKRAMLDRLQSLSLKGTHSSIIRVLLNHLLQVCLLGIVRMIRKSGKSIDDMFGGRTLSCDWSSWQIVMYHI